MSDSDLSPLKRAFLKIEEMQAKLAALEQARREPLAVVGMGCRLPGGAINPDAFWRVLQQGVDAVGEIPGDRWDVEAFHDPDPKAPGKMTTRWGAFLEGVDEFDPQFFGISPREALSLDPQQRLLLEVAWEALEDAGIAPDKLSGSRTGVFVAMCKSDYLNLQLEGGDPARFDVYYASGSAHSVASGRLSYVLGAQGPSITVDTACSSSLVAVHLACQSLRSGESRMALVGGVNLILSPENTITFSKSAMLSPDGRCKTFDAAADGFVQGEGCGVVVLKRLSDALAHGDRVLALIRGSAVNQDGPSSGLTAPNGPAQEAVIREALANGGVAPSEVGYVEAHGTGTSLGDPIEVRALGAVLGRDRSKDRPLFVGAVKTNIGHLEGAAGLAGLIKVVLALQHGQIPAHLHFQRPSPHIPWDELPLRVPTRLTPWPDSNRRIAGVSSFGFSGTNAHVVLEQAPEVAPKTAEVERPRHVLALSAKSPEALRELGRRFEARLAEDPELPIADVCHTAGAGRAHLSQRLAVVADSRGQLREALRGWEAGEEVAGLFSGRMEGPDRPRIAFLYTGQGSQYVGMGRRLYETQPVFRAALDRCDGLLRGQLERPLLSVLYPGPGEASPLDETAYTQPALFALEHALTELWRSWGIEPAAVMGHSVGEVAAACAAGVFSLEGGLRLIAERGRLMQALTVRGAMAAIMADEERAQREIARHGDQVAVAALNGPESVVISGAEAAVGEILASLEAQGVKTRRLTVSHAFHSPLMDPMLDRFEEATGEVQCALPRVPLISNLTGCPVREEITRARYWRRHAREPVRFLAAIRELHRLGYRLFVEIGPSPTLLGMGRGCVPEGGTTWLPSLRRGADDWSPILDSLATLYVRGAEVDWAGFDRGYPRRRVTLPTYPFQRRRYWIDAGPRAAGRARDLGAAPCHPLLGRAVRSPLVKEVLFESTFSLEAPAFVADHRVYGTVVLPAVAYLEMASGAAAQAFGAGTHVVEDMVIREALVIPEQGSRNVQLVVTPSDGERAGFQVISLNPEAGDSWRLHAGGTLRRGTEVAGVEAAAAPLAEVRARCGQERTCEEHYRLLREHGIDFGPAFRGVERIWRRDGEAVGLVRLPESAAQEADAYSVHPALLDACLQIVAAALPERGGSRPEDAFMPIGIRSFEPSRRAATALWSHALVHPAPGPSSDTLTADIRVYDEAGGPVATLTGLQLKRADRASIQPSGPDALGEWLYEVQWLAKPLPAREAPASPRSIVDRVAPRAVPLALEHGLDLYDTLLPRLDALSAAHVRGALRQLGCELRRGCRLSVPALEERGALPRHRRLLARMLEILEEEGQLRRTGSEWEVVSVDLAEEPQHAMAAGDSFGGSAELELLARAGRSLADVLRGQFDPLQVLFPDGSFAIAERLYEGSPAARVFQTLAQEALVAAVASLPEGRPARVLEVGAGTGGTTAFVLPKLPPERTAYTFSDLSGLFLARAQERFEGFPFVSYRVLDIEQDPEGQGFAANTFDIVLASNVLHATADLRRSLRHVRRLLAPGGLLVLAEGTRPQRWIDLTFGLTEGWWKFEDVDERPSYPLLSRERWLKLLAEAGFEEATGLPADSENQGRLSDHTVILARAPQSDRGTEARASAPGRWVVLADEGGVGARLAERLRARGEDSVLVSAGEGWGVSGDGSLTLNPARPADFRRLLLELREGDRPCLGVIHLWALDAPPPEETASARLEPAQLRSCGAVLHLVQALAAAVDPPRLWLVTRGAQAVDPGPVAVAQAPLWGLGKVVALEHPELRCVRVDLDPVAGLEAGDALLEELRAPDAEDQVAFRDGARRVARLVRSPWRARLAGARPGPGTQPVELEVTIPGSLDGLALRPASRRRPGRGEVEIRVHATGLNFRDVLNALGMRRDEEPLGGECAGTIVGIGDGVEDLRVGDEVVAITVGGFSTFVTAPATLVLRKPSGLGFEEAATLPLAFLTARYALHEVGRIAAGETVLIHAAAGGVGLAAVQLARRAGARVFATAGSPQKRDFLQSLGVAHVMDSRSLAFADEVLEQTQGLGVEVVLNSLTGEFIPKGLSVLRPGGRFLEIGKAEIWEPARVARVRSDVSYFAVDLAERLHAEPERIRPLLVELLEAAGSGAIRPLPLRAFPLEEAPAAFRYMAQARHIGKVVLSQREARVEGLPDRFSSDGTYLITGGLRGLGLRVALWMAERGAGSLVLMGRSAASAEAQDVIRTIEGMGTTVRAAQGDVSREEDLRRALEEAGRSLPPLRGVVHSAGVLDDGGLLQLTWERFTRVMAPKVDGAWKLHALTQGMELDHFVLFSSAAALVGSPGQGNHAAANAFLDGLAHQRRSAGLPALSINWGAWAEVGAAAERNVGERIEGQGLRAFSPEQGLALLEGLLRPKTGAPPPGQPAQVGVMPVDWSRFLQRAAGTDAPAFYAELARETRPAAPAPGPARGDLQRQLQEAPPNQRPRLLRAYVRERAGKVLGLGVAEAVDPRQPLRELGLDSLMAVELRNLLASGLGFERRLPATLLFDYPSIADLVDYLAREVFSFEPPPGPGREAPAEPSHDALASIEQLSEDDVERMFKERVDGGGLG